MTQYFATIEQWREIRSKQGHLYGCEFFVRWPHYIALEKTWLSASAMRVSVCSHLVAVAKAELDLEMPARILW